MTTALQYRLPALRPKTLTIKPRDFNPLLAETALFQFVPGLLLSLSFVSTGIMTVAH